MIDRQSMEAEPGEAQADRLGDREEAGRGRRRARCCSYPVGDSCWQPWVKGLTIMVNSIYNGWRMEDVWLDKKS